MWIRSLIITIALCMLAATNSLGAGYNIIDLGAPPYSCAYGLNHVGQVVGESNAHAFLWDSVTGTQDIGPVGWGHLAINNNGQVAGTSGGHAFMWSAETGMVDLGTLNGGQSLGYDITNDGHVFGVSITGDRKLQVFEWSTDSGMHDLGLPDGVVGPDRTISVNEAHQIAGTFWDAQSGGYHAFLWDAPGGMRDIGIGSAYSISNNGNVVGYSRDQAFLWDSTGGMRLLGNLPGGNSSTANDVNDLGQIIGQANRYDGSRYSDRAFIWEEATGMIELPSLGGSYDSATAINSAGLIAGYSSTPDGVTHAVIWQPVPEPSSLAALALGLAPLAAAGIRRKRWAARGSDAIRTSHP